MKLPDTATVSNRIGRIVLASILAGLLASIGVLLSQTLDIHGYASHSVTEPVDLYFAFMSTAMEVVVIVSAILAIAMPVYWLLTRRFEPKLVLVPAFLLTASVAAFVSYIESSPTLYEYFVEAIGLIWIVAAIFVAVAVVEAASESTLFGDLSLRSGVTTMGGIVMATLVLVFLTVGGVNLAVTAADAAGVTAEEPTSEAGMSPDEFRAEYGSLTTAEVGSDLTCSESHLQGTEPVLPASETHWNDLSAWGANVAIEEGRSGQAQSLNVNFSTPDADRLALVKLHEDEPDGFSSAYTYSEQSIGFEETAFAFEGAESHNPISETPRDLDHLSLDLYVVNDDGEVIRYTGNLCAGGQE